MTAFLNHFAFEFRTGVRDKTLLLMNYLLPLGFYFMMGFVMVDINPAFGDVLLPAMVTFAVLSAALLGVPDPLVSARESGIFRSYKINGVPAINILLMPFLTTASHLLIVVAIISITAGGIFNAPMPINWVNFVLVLLAGVFASIGLGVLIGVLAPSSRLTVLFSQAIYLPSMLLGGLMIPTSALPEAAQPFSFLLPSAHMMNAFQSLAMGIETGFGAWLSMGVLVGGGVLALGLAWFLFQWDDRSGKRRAHPLVGLLALLPYLISMVWLN